ncbi:MAG: ThiF family adenylyltransferase, partial [Parcubacteria group bacterium]|nr:ThiF family adenylyltransferase [Parcubacteria group bacterium]
MNNLRTPQIEVEKALATKLKMVTESKPRIFNLSKTRDQQKVQKLLVAKTTQRVIDDYKEQLREYFQVQNPRLVFALEFEKRFMDYLVSIEKKTPLWQHGRWIFFPWISTLVHILEDKQFQLVRTARNKNLITQNEQKKFYNAVIGVAGLSVGNSVALAIVLQGGGQRMRLADHDRLALSNLNRIRAGVDSLSIKKTEMTARQIYLLNPYVKLELFSDGLTEKNIKKFFEGPPRLDIVVDETDNL